MAVAPAAFAKSRRFPSCSFLEIRPYRLCFCRFFTEFLEAFNEWSEEFEADLLRCLPIIFHTTAYFRRGPLEVRRMSQCEYCGLHATPLRVCSGCVTVLYVIFVSLRTGFSDLNCAGIALKPAKEGIGG